MFSVTDKFLITMWYLIVRTYVREITYEYNYVLISILSALVLVIHTIVKTYDIYCMYVSNRQCLFYDKREITFVENYRKSLFALEYVC